MPRSHHLARIPIEMEYPDVILGNLVNEVFSGEYESGIITCSSALVRGSRLKLWNTKPIILLRISARRSALARETSSRSSVYVPDVG